MRGRIQTISLFESDKNQKYDLSLSTFSISQWLFSTLERDYLDSWSWKLIKFVKNYRDFLHNLESMPSNYCTVSLLCLCNLLIVLSNLSFKHIIDLPMLSLLLYQNLLFLIWIFTPLFGQAFFLRLLSKELVWSKKSIKNCCGWESWQIFKLWFLPLLKHNSKY